MIFNASMNGLGDVPPDPTGTTTAQRWTPKHPRLHPRWAFWNNVISRRLHPPVVVVSEPPTPIVSTGAAISGLGDLGGNWLLYGTMGLVAYLVFFNKPGGLFRKK